MSRLLFTAIMAAMCAALPLCAQPKKSEKQTKMTTPHSFSRQRSRVVAGEYLLFLPADYYQNKSKHRPMIVFLHGAGERGNDVWRANIHGPIKYAVEHPDFPFIIVSPICPADQVWSNDIVMEAIDEVIIKYKADTRRVYLTGLSMGGFGTWSLAAAYPDKFAAVAPICGGGDVLPFLLAAKGFCSKAKKDAIQNLCIWTFHGAKDTVVPMSESERMVDAAKAAGAREIMLTVYPDAQHDSWTQTYNNPELYQWFLKHEKAPKAKR